MAWAMYYNGEPIIGPLAIEKVDEISELVLKCLESGQPVWHDVHYPKGDGVGFHRMLITPGVAISFHEYDPSGPDDTPLSFR
ncbi:hypothetical protein [Cryobacterium sp. HLT2-28]|uniref:hypothetical protein n=1 Tax=Cryobacterium sp. HLT2-28 TaxID=1259146 RepID=UPI001069F3B8|nr:hypothetical protein [Cryobacterium sp. HLT2-28]TFB92784.1 hypothetical protein E3O48_13560 [Cryobacterium sp. HLT2-28]